MDSPTYLVYQATSAKLDQVAWSLWHCQHNYSMLPEETLSPLATLQNSFLRT